MLHGDTALQVSVTFKVSQKMLQIIFVRFRVNTRFVHRVTERAHTLMALSSILT